MQSEAQRKRAFTTQYRTRSFGRYETLFRIAGGGMAEVYAARISGEGGFQKVVALKRMLPTLAEDERFVQMFLDEGRLAAHISSPNVVQTLDLGRAEDDSLYLVMELVVGVPLNQLLKGVLKSGSHIQISVACEIIAQAAMGLHDAHEATTPMGERLAIVHRDVSPQNILVDKSGRVRITDFGVARALQRTSQTQSGEVKGKMAYFAPEQAAAKELDRRVDVFALGVVAWEVLAGKRLFRADNPLLTLQKVLHHPVPLLNTIRPNIPDGVAKAVAKALERDRDKRYMTAREFATDLREAMTVRASPTEVGEYISKHGGESLKKLDENLKAALAIDPADHDLPDLPDINTGRSTTDGYSQVRRPAPDPSQTLRTQRPTKRPNSSTLVVGAALLFVLGVIATILVARELRDPRPHEVATPLSSGPMVEPAAPNKAADEAKAPDESELALKKSDEVEAATTATEKAEKTTTKRSRSSRNTRRKRADQRATEKAAADEAAATAAAKAAAEEKARLAAAAKAKAEAEAAAAAKAKAAQPPPEEKKGGLAGIEAFKKGVTKRSGD